MKPVWLAGAALTLAVAAPAWAQTTGATGAQTGSSSPTMNSPSDQQGGSGQQNPHAIQRIRSDLEKAGFSNIRVMPESFLVHAQDREGRPVMMVINPDSITAVTAIGPAHGNARTASNAETNSNSTGNSNNTNANNTNGTGSNGSAAQHTNATSPNR